MKQKDYKEIFNNTDFVHKSGSEEELKVAKYLKEYCEKLGFEAHLESFKVAMAEMKEAHLWADGKEVSCKGMYCCGSGEVEGELYYMPATDPVSIAGAKDKIVLLDNSGIGFFTYQDLMKAGAKGIIFQYGNAHFPNNDIDERDLRPHVVGEERKVMCAMVNVKEGMKLVKNKVKTVKISIDQREYEGQSQNVVCTIPGSLDQYIVLSAHYDSTALSHGAYDNMTGCVGILAIADALKGKTHNFGLKLVFCGSEERGLLGSKAYVKDHSEELEKCVLNINLDMIGTYMGKFISRVSAEEKLTSYISYMAAEKGFPVAAKSGVYSSDSTPFADAGVPAISFARMANENMVEIHCRYDLKDVLSMSQLESDIEFITEFTKRMADAKVCPVKREIPEKIRTELDEYLFKKRHEA